MGAGAVAGSIYKATGTSLSCVLSRMTLTDSWNQTRHGRCCIGNRIRSKLVILQDISVMYLEDLIYHYHYRVHAPPISSHYDTKKNLPKKQPNPRETTRLYLWLVLTKISPLPPLLVLHRPDHRQSSLNPPNLLYSRTSPSRHLTPTTRWTSQTVHTSTRTRQCSITP